MNNIILWIHLLKVFNKIPSKIWKKLKKNEIIFPIYNRYLSKRRTPTPQKISATPLIFVIAVIRRDSTHSYLLLIIFPNFSVRCSLALLSVLVVQDRAYSVRRILPRFIAVLVTLSLFRFFIYRGFVSDCRKKGQKNRRGKRRGMKNLLHFAGLIKRRRKEYQIIPNESAFSLFNRS